MMSKSILSRRDFLKNSAVATTAGFFPNLAVANANVKNISGKALSFYNLHTGEHLETTFWEAGVYLPEGLAKINQILRDHRTNDVKAIDTKLIELLHTIHTNMESSKPFNIISGYRSPKTNAQLRSSTSGVAKKSFHMEGMAIDINLPGRELAQLNKAARELGKGGVGYYPQSGFIHIDVGHVRQWKG